jgi:hypothetical protein
VLPDNAAGPAGSAVSEMIVTRPATVNPASRHAAGAIGVCVRTAAIGSANSNVRVPSACTTPTVPKPSAATCRPAPTPVSSSAAIHRDNPRCPTLASRSWTTAAAA